MVGLQATSIKTQLGPLLNGIVNYDFWLPWRQDLATERKGFMKKYQAGGRRPASTCWATTCRRSAYAQMQVLQQAVEGDQGTRRGQAR